MRSSYRQFFNDEHDLSMHIIDVKRTRMYEVGTTSTLQIDITKLNVQEMLTLLAVSIKLGDEVCCRNFLTALKPMVDINKPDEVGRMIVIDVTVNNR